MADLKRIDHLRIGDVVVHASGKVLFEVQAVHGWVGIDHARTFAVSVRVPDGEVEQRRWTDPDSVWVMVAD